MKFRKQPVVIEAVQVKGQSFTETPVWLTSAVTAGTVRHIGVPPQYACEIETLEGTMHANDGDWIIQGVKGELYPCKADIFDMTYVPVVE